jgi:hypothetical protein
MIFPFLLCQSTSYLMNCSCDTVSVQDCDHTSAKQTHFNHLFNSWRANTLSLQLQRAFTVKQYLAPHSYITCKDQFWDEFSKYHLPHKSVLSGELFAWHKQCAGQKIFLSRLSVFWQFGQYLSHFVTLSKKIDEITCSLDLDYHMEVYCTLQRFQTSSTSYASHAHFIWVWYRYFRQKFPLLLKHGFTLVDELLPKTSQYEAWQSPYFTWQNSSLLRSWSIT